MEADEFYCCALSKRSVKEIMTDPDEKTDCLGFGLVMRRPEFEWDESTAAHIPAVSETMISRSALKNESSEFEKDGMSINAWLPLYICPLHWDRAKALLKDKLDYPCTYAPMGNKNKQLDVMFHSLGRMIGELPLETGQSAGDHQLKLLIALHRTCSAVVEEFDLQKHMIEAVQNFMKSPEGSTEVILSDLSTLVGYVMCLPRNVLSDMFSDEVSRRHLWLAVAGEAVRRAAENILKKSTPPVVNGALDNILNCKDEAVISKEEACSDLMNKCHAERGKPWEPSAYEPIREEDIPKPQLEHTTAMDKAMEIWAQHKCDVIENVQMYKVTHARENVENWMETGKKLADDAMQRVTRTDLEDDMDGAGQAADLSSQSPDFDPERISSSIVDNLAKALGHLDTVLYPSMSGIASCMAYLEFCMKTSPDWEEMDKAWGVVPETWITAAKQTLVIMAGKLSDRTTIPDPAATDGWLSLPQVLACMKPAITDVVQLTRAILCQAITSSARTAAKNRTMYALDTGELQICNECLRNLHTRLQQYHKKILDLAHYRVQWQRANYSMLHAKSLWAFIGYMMCTYTCYTSRGEGFMELLNTMVDPEVYQTVPFLKDKIKVMLTGKMGEHSVLHSGNIWLPEHNMAMKIKAAVDHVDNEAWKELDMELRSSTRIIHIYRLSDIPNRQGHCNSNPYITSALRIRLGMN